MQEPLPAAPSPDREGGHEDAEVLMLVLDESTDPIFNILEDGTYRYLNKAFSEAFGKRIWDVFPPDEAEKRMAVVRKSFATGETIVFEVRVPLPAGDRFYITSVKPIKNAQGRVLSVVCISKEITDRKREEVERERLIRELQDALAEVHTLSGLLPICAQCKKIRDDHGYWTLIESYISAHSQARFSHGICPDCARELYPDAIQG